MLSPDANIPLYSIIGGCMMFQVFVNRGFIGIFNYKNVELAVSDGKVLTVSLFTNVRVFL